MLFFTISTFVLAAVAHKFLMKSVDEYDRYGRRAHHEFREFERARTGKY